MHRQRLPAAVRAALESSAASLTHGTVLQPASSPTRTRTSSSVSRYLTYISCESSTFSVATFNGRCDLQLNLQQRYYLVERVRTGTRQPPRIDRIRCGKWVWKHRLINSGCCACSHSVQRYLNRHRICGASQRNLCCTNCPGVQTYPRRLRSLLILLVLVGVARRQAETRYG